MRILYTWLAFGFGYTRCNSIMQGIGFALLVWLILTPKPNTIP